MACGKKKAAIFSYFRSFVPMVCFQFFKIKKLEIVYILFFFSLNKRVLHWKEC